MPEPFLRNARSSAKHSTRSPFPPKGRAGPEFSVVAATPAWSSGPATTSPAARFCSSRARMLASVQQNRGARKARSAVAAADCGSAAGVTVRHRRAALALPTPYVRQHAIVRCRYEIAKYFSLLKTRARGARKTPIPSRQRATDNLAGFRPGSPDRVVCKADARRGKGVMRTRAALSASVALRRSAPAGCRLLWPGHASVAGTPPLHARALLARRCCRADPERSGR